MFFNENVFSPELVLVAGGFDAAQGDPLGGYCLRNSTQPDYISIFTFFSQNLEWASENHRSTENGRTVRRNELNLTFLDRKRTKNVDTRSSVKYLNQY